MDFAKVVRVEQALSPVPSEGADSLLETEGTKLSGNHLKEYNGTLLEASTAYPDADIEEEAQDVVALLPEGWPLIPQLLQKKISDSTKSVYPVISKATSHLELLQTIIEEWFRDQQSRQGSRQTKRNTPSSDSPVHIGRRSLRFSGNQSKNVRNSEKAPASASSSVGSSQLSIHGVGARADADGKKTVTVGEQDIPYLGAEEVIDEVVTLLARLENDRQETLDTLQSERSRVETIRSKIDTLNMKRMVELPEAIQREHEACAMDIAELNWHCSYRSRNESRIKTKAQVAEALNGKLKEDISFVKKHIPLVEEKLCLEVDAMKRVAQAQTDTNDELGVTMDRCQKVEGKSNEATNKADQERNSITKDLDSVQADLTKISEDLAEAKMTHNSYIHLCNDYRQQLVDNDAELIVLEVKDINVRTAEAAQQERVTELQDRIYREEIQHRQLDDEIFKKTTEKEGKMTRYARTLAKLEQTISDRGEELRAVSRKNQELDMDIGDTQRKNDACIRQKLKDEKNLERMIREVERTEDQINMAQDDLSNVLIFNNAIKEQLQNEEEKCIQAEESLRTTAENLKRQVKEEIHTKTMLAARITSDGGEFESARDEVIQKKEVTSMKADEVSTAVQQVLGKVEKLRAAHSDKEKSIASLREQLKQLREKQEQHRKMVEADKEAFSPQYKEVKAALLDITKKLDHMEWRSDMMNKKKSEMSESARMMTRSMNNTKNQTNSLQAEMDELSLKLKASQHLQDSITLSLQYLSAQVRDRDKQHRDLMTERNIVETQTEENLKKNVELNHELASQYRRLQTRHLWVKNNMLNKMEARISMEGANKDLKQVKGLQSHMHCALMEYFKFRNLYNHSELASLQDDSQHNAVRVGGLQTQMDGALDKITHFLQDQMDGDTIRKMAMEKVEAEELAEAQIKCPPLLPQEPHVVK